MIILKKVLKWLFYILLTLIIGITASIYLFKDRIIRQVLAEVDNYLAVPVNVTKVDIDFLHGLPNISIAFYDVELSANEEPMITAKKIYAIINPLEILRGELNIARIEIVDADLNLYVDSSNKINLDKLFKVPDEKNLDTEDTTAVGFDLNSIVLVNVNLTYKNDIVKSTSKVLIKKLKGDFRLVDGVYQSKVNTQLDLLEQNSASWSATDIGLITTDFDINYEVASKILTLDQSHFTFRGAKADIVGSINFASKPDVNLSVRADDISFKLLAEFLPAKLLTSIKEYKSSGLINFDASLIGQYTNNTMPELKAELRFEDVDLTHEEFNANVSDLKLSCKVLIKDISRFSTGELSIEKSSGMLMGKPFGITFKLRNFSNPTFSGNVKAELSPAWLLAASKFQNYESGKGLLDLSLDFDNIKSSETLLEGINVSGLIDFNNVSFALNDSVQVNNIDGRAQFNPERIQLSNLRMDWLSSDITINGDIIDHETSDNSEELILRSEVKSTKLAIEDVVLLARASSELFVTDSSSGNDIQLDLDLIASFDSLTFRRFKGAQINGEFLYQDKVVEAIEVNGKAMGGALKLNGKLKDMPNQDIIIQANVKTKGVYIDSLFYVFHNFTQDFIRDENLRGRVYADVDASMYFDQNWRFRRKLLSSYAKIGIVGGELNDFEPIMALSPYLDDEDDNLAQLKFSDIVTNIQIKEDTVFIPEMSIRTNVRNIALGGYHTLDQHINYRLAVPIINESVDKDEAFGAVQKSSKGSPNLLFRIKGTTSDYKVNYDLLRATGNVLKLLDITKIFKKKEEIEVDSSFLNDEEFDWRRE